MTTIKEETDLNSCKSFKIRKNLVAAKAVRSWSGLTQTLRLGIFSLVLPRSPTLTGKNKDLLNLKACKLLFCCVLLYYVSSFIFITSPRHFSWIHGQQSHWPNAVYFAQRFLKPTLYLSTSPTSDHNIDPKSYCKQAPDHTLNFH